ncbi:hypothetical protein UFOVP648_23 [uncultured Caudovirales phage]|uniref:Uncharacterized protein n=1 Tax=uncultured Caudovirales phage TaxID=2100421 RepID=A0A6J5NGZ5_9CAUD|nr:hypothetical protein UFOVP648_23 [uncultured Caudovirales phage]
MFLTLGNNVIRNRVFDVDANAFINAVGSLDGAQENAIQYLTVSLKEYNLWNKMTAIYPIIGGTASSHGYNLKDPRNLDAAFRISFLGGGWTHSATGAKGNGTSAYGNTFLTASTRLANNNVHLSYYSRTQLQETSNIDFGAASGVGAPNIMSMSLPRATTNTASFIQGSNTAGVAVQVTGITVTAAYYIGTRTASTIGSSALFINGVLSATSKSANTTGILPTRPFYLNALNNDAFATSPFYSAKECAFASIGSGLTSNDVSNLYRIVEDYQSLLKRNVVNTSLIKIYDVQTIGDPS